MTISILLFVRIRLISHITILHHINGDTGRLRSGSRHSLNLTASSLLHFSSGWNITRANIESQPALFIPKPNWPGFGQSGPHSGEFGDGLAPCKPRRDYGLPMSDVRTMTRLSALKRESLGQKLWARNTDRLSHTYTHHRHWPTTWDVKIGFSRATMLPSKKRLKQSVD